MTKYIDPTGEHAAVRRAHALLGDEGMERVTRRTASLARNWADPDQTYHHIPFHQALSLDCELARMGQETPFLTCMVAAVKAMVPTPAQRPMTLPEGMAAIGKQFGEFATVLGKSLRDGRLTAAEKKRLAKECDDIIAEAHAVKRGLR